WASNFRSLSKMTYRYRQGSGKASRNCCTIHSAVGCCVTLQWRILRRSCSMTKKPYITRNVTALCPVSYLTTFLGFQTIFDRNSSAAAAVGLQAAMITAWIFWGHNRAPARRLPWLCAGLFTCVLSISFSFVGLRSYYKAEVLKRERPVRERQEFQLQRGRL